MTEMEMKQRFAQMPANEIMPFLIKIENAMQAIWPYSEAYAKVFVDKNDAEHERDMEQKKLKSNKHSLIMYVAVGVVVFFVGLGLKSFGSMITKFLAIGALIYAIITLLQIKSNKNKISNLEKTIIELESKVQSAWETLEKVKKPHAEGIYLKGLICPECRNPESLRLFISYFENGRAFNLNQARSLYEEYLHRLKMEETANQQLQSIKLATQAALDAKDAAMEASIAAEQARNEAYRSNLK